MSRIGPRDDSHVGGISSPETEDNGHWQATLADAKAVLDARASDEFKTLLIPTDAAAVIHPETETTTPAGFSYIIGSSRAAELGSFMSECEFTETIVYSKVAGARRYQLTECIDPSAQCSCAIVAAIELESYQECIDATQSRETLTTTLRRVDGGEVTRITHSNPAVFAPSEESDSC